MPRPLAGMLIPILGLFIGAGPALAGTIEGSWSGSGTVRLASGHVEPVRCRISYQESTGRTFVIRANCSHANGTFEQSGRVVKLGASQYSGRLYSNQYDVAGNLRITVNGGRQTLRAFSDKGTAQLNLKKR